MRKTVALFSTLVALAWSAFAAADDAPPPAGPLPEQARGWDEPPEPERIPVLSPIGAALGATARFAVDAIAAPFRGAVYLESRYRTFSRARDFFYNDDHTAGFVPTLSFATVTGGRIGATAFHRNLFGNGETVALSGSFGGMDRYSVQLRTEVDRVAGSRFYVRSRSRFEIDDQVLFQGIGNDGDMSDPLRPQGDARYGEQRMLSAVSAGVHLGKLSTGLSFIHNDREFDQDVATGMTAIGDVYDVAQLEGFDSGVKTNELTADVELDLRDHAGKTGSGAMLTGFGGGTIAGDGSYAHYGAEATVYVSPWRPRRVFALRLAHEGVHGDDIPFTELPRLGGAETLRGYRRDRFRDELSTLATLEYRYPIHNLLSGALFVEAGKVAGDYDSLIGSDFTENWHVGYGGGLVFHTSDNIVISAELAYGDGLEVYFMTDALQAFRKRGRQL